MNYLSHKKTFFSRGTTLVETLVAIAFFVGVSMALYGVYQKVSVLLASIKVKTVATNIANEQFEIIRNMSYSSVGTSGGIPSGTLPQTQTIVRDGISFEVDIAIRNIDQPYDGTLGGNPNDTAPADNKHVEIEVACTQCKYTQPFIFSSLVAPKNLELSSNNGALFVQVFDANGLPVSEAEVTVVNSSVTPAVNLTDETNIDGFLQIIDVPPSSIYDVSVTKNGYSSSRTYTSAELLGSTPITPQAFVASQTITQISLAIDLLSTLTVESVTSVCAPVSDFDFSLTGTKKIGTNPDVVKFDDVFETGAGGSLSLPDLEWDTYTISPIDVGYDLIGSNPLLQFDLAPNSSQAIQFIVAPKAPSTLMVTVKDSATDLPISGATVELDDQSSSFENTKNTGQGFFSQTDWSGGGGQATFVSADQYFLDNGSVDFDVLPGTLTLHQTGSVYASSGTLESSTFDSGSSSTNYNEILWLPTDQSPLVGSDSVKFQIASNNDNATWTFTGPDATANTYYTLSNKTLGSHHSGNRYIRYKLFLSTSDTSATPLVSDISLTYSSSCTPPGQVSFQNLAQSTYALTVSKTGYNDSSTLITIDDDWQQADVVLTP
ncbi:MAG: carboxypeptidase regulatory-like domain-containing protein [Candidatus Pacebacteria bacterium]|nr:carboxypeptidase regulatory-like domain-containing protein [Candidatus Paceibacterota bacterium]MBP9780799.1 carboxypeptidase regulatory-like domain-containing protein [Candidatus Paceibacterota bacterium]